MQANLILYAPNVHTGGGVVLLNELLSVWPAEKSLHAFLDIRARRHLVPLHSTVKVTWVAPRVLTRLRAEFLVYQASNRNNATIFCFHGLPPLLPLRGNIVIFIQNRLLIEHGKLTKYPFKVRVRLWIERLWGRTLQNRCARYIVQTPSMAAVLRDWLRCNIPVSVVPFASPIHATPSLFTKSRGKKFDFVYVASGEAHKNHRNLLEAWHLLTNAGLKPSLALTINPESYPSLANEVSRYAQEYELNIVNLGHLPAVDIPLLYQSSSALIFPSQVESFGLPLIEATQLGLPILASELDYVRDVIQPTETFDPNSPVSIARAVKRFLGKAESTVQIRSAEEFLAEVLK